MPAFSLPPLLTDRLKAVNAMLQSIGEAPVSSVEVSQAVDVAAANGALDEVTNAVLSEGWNWNREYGLTLTPNASNQIPLPANCLSIVNAYWEGSLGIGEHGFTERGRFLYDLDNHTYTITDPVKVDIKVLLTWEEMPEYARRYIAIRACQLFQARIQGTRIVYEVQSAEVEMARATLEQNEAEAEPANGITGNVETLGRLYGRGVRRRL